MSMHPKMAAALKALDFGDTATNPQLRAQADAVFKHLHVAGFLSRECIHKAVTYCQASSAFATQPEVIEQLLNEAIAKSVDDDFNIDVFLNNFAKEECFEVVDIIDIIAFLSQFAFDRAFGKERDSLTAKPWMAESANVIIDAAGHLDMLQGNKPSHKDYLGAAVMGAATPRVRARIDFFKTLPQCYHTAWALSGKRQLKEGLDEAEEMRKIAELYGKPYELGGAENKFLDITETQMVNYYLATRCQEIPIRVVDSAAEKEHWRATTQQSASDVAKRIVKMIQDQELEVEAGQEYHFMIVAEQPYLNRMTRQVQREFNMALAAAGINDIKITVEGCGESVSAQICQSPAEHLTPVTRINSELAVTLMERVIDARLQPQFAKRDVNILLFRYRDNLYKDLVAEHTVTSVEQQTPVHNK